VFVKFFGAPIFEERFYTSFMFDESIQDLSLPFRAQGACAAYIAWMHRRSRTRCLETNFGSKSHLAESVFCVGILSRQLFVLNELERLFLAGCVEIFCTNCTAQNCAFVFRRGRKMADHAKTKGRGLVSRLGGWGEKGLTSRRDCVAPGT
jgi:hypothetical protein